MTNQTFPAKTEALPDILGFVEETLERYECPMKTQMAVCVAIEEVFVNVAHYAYGDGEGEVTLGISFDEAGRTVTFRMTVSNISRLMLNNGAPAAAQAAATWKECAVVFAKRKQPVSVDVPTYRASAIASSSSAPNSVRTS